MRPVTHGEIDIFRYIGSFQVTCYHSLHVKLEPRASESHIFPLAWDVEDSFNGDVLMAARHRKRPLWGVQYHPESICTDAEGQKVVSSWWKEAKGWNCTNSRQKSRQATSPPVQQEVKERHRLESFEQADRHFQMLSQKNLLPQCGKVHCSEVQTGSLDLVSFCETLGSKHSDIVVLRSGRAPGQPVVKELGRYTIIGQIEANSTLKFNYHVKQQALTLETSVKQHCQIFSSWHDEPSKQPSYKVLSEQVSDFWNYINRFMSNFDLKDGNADIPFWGGLIGYISYEAGLETISVPVENTMESSGPPGCSRPDVQFVFVERSIVIDHLTERVYIQSLRGDDQKWTDDVLMQIHKISSGRSSTGGVSPDRSMNGVVKVNRSHTTTEMTPEKPLQAVHLRRPNEAEYIRKISHCDKAIRRGDSYELCLTDCTKIYTTTMQTNQSSGWSLFKRLGHTNPAPFSAYMRLTDPSDGLTIVSSSPERFLKWDRKGQCQFRPIKGTVKKTAGVTFEDAKRVLNSSKEQAENLMITDLIRHDLHGVAGAGNVSVPKLMQIEEYATVYQLVSVIEGNGLHASTSSRQSKTYPTASSNGSIKDISPTGIEVLAASLPPGSMTGAPKKRSCELLAEIEQCKPRGLYSGVIGYIDIGGGGDFSVVIRTAYKWDSDNKYEKGHVEHGVRPKSNEGAKESLDRAYVSQVVEEWTVGAGGAITAQSDAEQEYQEMMTKLNSVLGGFDILVESDVTKHRKA